MFQIKVYIGRERSRALIPSPTICISISIHFILNSNKIKFLKSLLWWNGSENQLLLHSSEILIIKGRAVNSRAFYFTHFKLFLKTFWRNELWRGQIEPKILHYSLTPEPGRTSLFLHAIHCFQIILYFNKRNWKTENNKKLDLRYYIVKLR